MVSSLFLWPWGINESLLYRGVVRINIAKLNPKEVKVIDLTDVSVREKHIARDSIAWEYANRFEEVILDPKTRVPAECVQKIGTVRRRSFTKFKNVTLWRFWFSFVLTIPYLWQRVWITSISYFMYSVFTVYSETVCKSRRAKIKWGKIYLVYYIYIYIYYIYISLFFIERSGSLTKKHIFFN